jgi:hypothetical protein
MDALKFQIHKNKEIKQFYKTNKAYKNTQINQRSTSATPQNKLRQNVIKPEFHNSLNINKRKIFHNLSLTEEKNLDVITDELSKKLFRNFLKFFTEEGEKSQ